MGISSAITIAVVASHITGLSQRKIAKLHHISEPTVTEILKSRGYLPARRVSPGVDERGPGNFYEVPIGLVDAYTLEGLSIDAVGERFDIARSTVRLMLLREGVQLRPARRPKGDLSRTLHDASDWMRTVSDESAAQGAEASLFTMLATWLAVESKAAAIVVRARQFDPADFYPAIAFAAELPIDPTLKVLADYLSGMTIPDVAERHNYSYGKARHQLIAHKVKFRNAKRRLPPTPPGLVDAYTTRGLSIVEVATEFDIGRTQASNMLRREGVKLRPPVRQQRRQFPDPKPSKPQLEGAPLPEQTPISMAAMTSGLKHIYREAGNLAGAAAILDIGTAKMRGMLSDAGIAIYPGRTKRPRKATRRHCDEDEDY